MRLVDAHCHLDLYPDPAAILAACESRGIYTIAVTNAPAAFPACRVLVGTSRYVRAALGLHPELALARELSLARFIALLPQTRYVGEVGLDYATGDAANRAAQRRVFGAVVDACTAAGGKILTVHSRRAVADVLATIGDEIAGRTILHWFTGSPRQAERAITQGCYFSVNPPMASSESGQRLLALLPRERVLTETDGPFVRLGAEPAQPPSVARVLTALARHWGGRRLGGRPGPGQFAASAFRLASQLQTRSASGSPALHAAPQGRYDGLSSRPHGSRLPTGHSKSTSSARRAPHRAQPQKADAPHANRCTKGLLQVSEHAAPRRAENRRAKRDHDGLSDLLQFWIAR